MILSSFMKNPQKTWYDGADHDESITYVFRKSLLTLIPVTLVCTAMILATPYMINALSNINIKNHIIFDDYLLGLITLFWYLLTFGIFFETFALWFFNVYIITNKKVVDIDFDGLLYKNISETQLRNIEDVTSQVKGFFGMIFNIGNVYVQTAAEKREFEFTELDRPEEIRDIISDLAEIKKRKAREQVND